MWFYCFNCALFSSKYAGNGLFFLIFFFFFLEIILDITRAMWLAMWHTTGVCFITSFNRIWHCRYFFVSLWNNWSKNKRRSFEMLERMEKFNVKAKVLYISIFNFCACAFVSGIPQTYVTQKNVNKCLNRPYLGYFSSELYEIFNISSIYRNIWQYVHKK